MSKAILLVCGLLFYGEAQACNCTRDDLPIKIDPQIEQTLRTEPDVHVIVVLRKSPALKEGKTKLAERKKLVRANQEYIFKNLKCKRFKFTGRDGIHGRKQRLVPADDYDLEISYQYQAINSFAGWVNRRGLEKLKNNILVKEIVKDPNGIPLLDKSARQIRADSVWQVMVRGQKITGKGVTAYIVDTGFDYTHEAFGGCTLDQIRNGTCPKIYGGYDVYSGDDDFMDYYSHGTHIAGIVGANSQDTAYIGGSFPTTRKSDVKGIAYEANLVGIKVCNDGATSCPGSVMEAGVDWAYTHLSDYTYDKGNVAAVVAMSISMLTPYTYPDCATWMDDTFIELRDANMFYAIGTGNDGATDGIQYPACSPYVTAVGNIDDYNNPYASGNRDPRVDVWAPGVTILSAELANTYGYKTGTSMSGPHVVGVAALLQQYSWEVYHTILAPDTIKAMICSTGVPITDVTSGLTRPLVNVKNALYTLVSVPVINLYAPLADTLVYAQPALVETFTVSAFDPLDSALTYHWYQDTTTLAVAADNFYVFTADVASIGEHILKCRVDNGQRYCDRDWVVNVDFEYLVSELSLVPQVAYVDSPVVISGRFFTNKGDTAGNTGIGIYLDSARLFYNRTTGLLDVALEESTGTDSTGNFSYAFKVTTPGTYEIRVVCNYRGFGGDESDSITVRPDTSRIVYTITPRIALSDSIITVSGGAYRASGSIVSNAELQMYLDDNRLFYSVTSGLLTTDTAGLTVTDQNGGFCYGLRLSRPQKYRLRCRAVCDGVCLEKSDSVMVLNADSCKTCQEVTALTTNFPGITVNLHNDLQADSGCTCIAVSKNNVTINGNHHAVLGARTKATRGIVATRVTGMQVHDLVVSKHIEGVRINYDTSCAITGVTVDSMGMGIYLNYAYNTEISHCTILDSVSGQSITLNFSDNNRIFSNVFSNRRGMGLGLIRSRHNVVRGNVFNYDCSIPLIISNSDSNSIVENLLFGKGTGASSAYALQMIVSRANNFWLNHFYKAGGRYFSVDTLGNNFFVNGQGNFYMDTIGTAARGWNDRGAVTIHTPGPGTIIRDNCLVAWKKQDAVTPLWYGLEYSADSGATWHPLATTADTLYTWRADTLADGDGYAVRITAYDSVARATPVLSGIFSIQQNVPVELTSFMALAEQQAVRLFWTTQTEADNLGWNVLRGTSAQGAFTQINAAMVPGAGTSALPHSYLYLDAGAAAGRTHYYRLEQLDIDGNKSYSPVVSAATDMTGIHRMEAGPNRGGDKTAVFYSVFGQKVNPATMPTGIYVKINAGQPGVRKELFINGQN